LDIGIRTGPGRRPIQDMLVVSVDIGDVSVMDKIAQP
jgi:hypothetical protein